MNKAIALFFLLLLLGGCNNGSDSASAPAGQGGAQPQPPVAGSTLAVNLAFPAVAARDPVPDNVARFVLEVHDAQTEELLAGPVALDRPAGETSLLYAFEGLPLGYVRLLVTALDAGGAALGFSDQILEVNGPLVETEVSSLFLPGPTRELGRISIGQENANGLSDQPALSSDGRFVAFSSSATNLVGTATTTPDRKVYLRDRVTGVITPVTPPTFSTLTDGTSNTIFFGETSPDSGESSPDLSGDARYVVYRKAAVFLDQGGALKLRDRLQPRGNRNVTPATVDVGSQSFEVRDGLEPKISEDGAKVVYTGTFISQPRQIVLFDRANAVSTVLSRNVRGELANGDCSHPVISSDGRLVFFSTTATNLGPTGLIVLDRTTGVFSLVSASSQLPCSVSRDGRLVVLNRDNRLLLVDRTTNTETEIPGFGSFAVLGAPSISGDGRFVTFCSARSDLVVNDQNNQTDVFVLDRTRQTFSRVNLANDGTAVEGGAETALGTGPVMARDGTRIAFASRDPLLVPADNNNITDVFSSANPTPGKLYVSTASAILRFDDVSTARGDLQPAATITSPDLGPGTSEIFLDTTNDRLYVATGTGTAVDKFLLFDNASTLNGSVTATGRIVRSKLTVGAGLFVDVANNVFRYGNSAMQASAFASGTTILAVSV